MSEALLRIVFAGGASFGNNRGPIARAFKKHYVLNQFDSRGPDTSGPKPPGTMRIFIQGDSLTFGQGVADARRIYAVRLFQWLNQVAPERFEMAVIASPGDEIDDHVENLEEYGAAIEPDLLIYQWFRNDVELDHSLRPSIRWPIWEALFFHDLLIDRSYTWFFAVDQLQSYVKAYPESYEDFYRRTYAPGTPQWLAVEPLLHRWARHATLLSPRVLVLFYPAVFTDGGPTDAWNKTEEAVKRLFSGYGIELVNAAEFFTGIEPSDKVFVNRFDGHPSEMMHQRMAQGLGRFLKTKWPELFDPRAGGSRGP